MAAEVQSLPPQPTGLERIHGGLRDLYHHLIHRERASVTTPTLLQRLDSSLQNLPPLDHESSLDVLNLSIIDTLLTSDPEVRSRMERFFPEDDIVTVNHSRNSDSFIHAGTFFRQLVVEGKISSKTFATLFDADGRWILRAPTDLHVYNLSPQEAGDRLTEVFGSMYDATTPSLEVSRPQFNMHDRVHLAHDRSYTESILSQVEGVTEDDHRLGQIMAVLHDGGNMLARDEHPFVVLLAAYRSMPQLFTDNPSLFYTVAVGILIHHSKQITALLDKWGLSMDSAVEFLERLGPAANAHVIADTADIGRPRVNLNGNRNDKLFEDPHTEANVYWHTNYVGVDPDDPSSFNLQLMYDPFVSKEDAEIFEGLQKPTNHGNGDRRLIPHPDVDQQYKTNGVPHFNTHSDKVMNIYGEQFALAAISAFALHSHVNKFVVDFYDPSLRASLEHKPEYAHFTPDQWEAFSHRILVIKRGEVETYREMLRGGFPIFETPLAA